MLDFVLKEHQCLGNICLHTDKTHSKYIREVKKKTKKDSEGKVYRWITST
jgi:hypothetical protein